MTADMLRVFSGRPRLGRSLYSLTLALSFASIASSNEAPANPKPLLDEKKLHQFDRLVQAMDLIQKHYFDDTKVSDEALIHGAIQGMLKTLDPHSEFLPQTTSEPAKRITEDYSPETGLSLALAEKHLRIATVLDASPAAAAGIESNDTLLRIGTIVTENLGLSDALKLLRGPLDSEVVLTIQSHRNRQERLVTLKRTQTAAELALQSFILPKTDPKTPNLGYLRVSRFNEGCGEAIVKHLLALDDKGAQGLVLDLRQNPGGYVTESFQLCDAFLEPGAPIASIEGRLQAHSSPPYITPETPKPKIWTYPLVVLIDHGSASASELVAGALKDSKRAVVIGTKSFGKGSVQTYIPLADGSRLKLTTGRYFTPDHRTIHEVGIEPNLVVVNPPEVEMELEAWRRLTLAPETKAAKLIAISDRQLQRAQDLLNGLLYMKNSEASSPSTPKP